MWIHKIPFRRLFDVFELRYQHDTRRSSHMLIDCKWFRHWIFCFQFTLILIVFDFQDYNGMQKRRNSSWNCDIIQRWLPHIAIPHTPTITRSIRKRKTTNCASKRRWWWPSWRAMSSRRSGTRSWTRWSWRRRLGVEAPTSTRWCITTTYTKPSSIKLSIAFESPAWKWRLWTDSRSTKTCCSGRTSWFQLEAMEHSCSPRREQVLCSLKTPSQSLASTPTRKGRRVGWCCPSSTRPTCRALWKNSWPGSSTGCIGLASESRCSASMATRPSRWTSTSTTRPRWSTRKSSSPSRPFSTTSMAARTATARKRSSPSGCFRIWRWTRWAIDWNIPSSWYRSLFHVCSDVSLRMFIFGSRWRTWNIFIFILHTFAARCRSYHHHWRFSSYDENRKKNTCGDASCSWIVLWLISAAHEITAKVGVVMELIQFLTFFLGLHRRNFISARQSSPHSTEFDAENNENEELGTVRVDRHRINFLAHQHQPAVEEDRRRSSMHSQMQRERLRRRRSRPNLRGIQPAVGVWSW